MGQRNNYIDSTTSFPMNDDYPKVGYRTKQQQCFAIVYKKVIYMREMWPYWILFFAFPIMALFICFGTIHRSITYKAPTKLIQLDLVHNNHPDVLVFMDYQDQLFHQRSFQDFVKSYNSTIRLMGSTVGSVKHELLTIEKSNITYYNEKVGCGVSMQFDSHLGNYLVTLLYSGNFLHSSPVVVNLVSNMFLRSMLKDKYEIHINNNPLTRDKLSASKSDLDIFVFVIPFAMFVYMLFYVMLPFNETVTKFKKLQNMSLLLFWLTNYAIDLLIHVVFCGIIYVVLNIADAHSIFEQKDYITLTMLLLFYGIGYIPLLYVFGQSFASMSSLFSFLLFFFLIFKNFSDASLLNSKKVYTYFTVVAIGSVLILLLVLENIYAKQRIINFLKCVRYRKDNEAGFKGTDVDVEEEYRVTELVVKGNLIGHYPLVVSNLRKCYGNVSAVKGISFTIKKGECFGLLGLNGAGKTTTFEMMMRNITISNGEIYFDGIGYKKTNYQTNNMYGYCPQVNALNDYMTSYESLKFMALLRGLNPDQIDKEVNRFIGKTDLTKYRNVRVSEYSGGTKRKLNTALAMIAHPPLVFLDEPTTGVDPTARRLIWSCIQDFQKHNKTILFNSHSMAECEYLCNRLAIMANGKIERIGSIQHLKNRFGKEFLLIVMINRDIEPSNSSKVKAYLTDSFECSLREEYAGKLSYIINTTKYEWSQVFRILQEFLIAFTNVVYDISILETSLEDILLQIESSLPSLRKTD